ncbi:sodium:solute symporter [Candidatus Cetobacterium colombiensis]|uniref:Sodium:solute symporter n=1 Tax=Candidatus Cetobacterium colombiensis TaxID=3073100 RepID=A0ABU4WF15_9FUSO|nr:sodium:solute symporter [Candidatus Cetobacterium colombiensis]MDX8337161.1 sodium:solute symporter [Candidatus Cetobacterium colombiensis]
MTWHWFNWLVLAFYFLAMVGIGVYFSKKNSSTTDYFTASGRIPSWVTACSIYATALSSISFIAIPASVFKSGAIMGMAPLGIILMVIWAAIVFVPFFRSINVTTAYEYLGRRFDNGFRWVGSLSFILFHLIRMAVVLYLPTLALKQALPSINPTLLLGAVSFLCVVYTSMGGIEAVVWSDAIQTIILLLGAFLIIIIGYNAAPDGLSMAFTTLVENGKAIPQSAWRLSFTGTTFVGILFGGFFNAIYSYVGSQDIVQRYNTTKNDHEAKKSLIMNVPLLCISVLIFCGMGTALFLFFKYKAVLPADIDGNAILPYFVINYIPVGFSGVILAAIFAAAQSTVSSSLNSLSTCVTSDIVAPLKKGLSDKDKLNIAKGVSWGAGIISTILAIRFLQAGQGDMFLYFQAITGLLGGPIAGLFLVGIFSRRVGNKAAWVGFIISVAVAVYIGNPADILTKLIPGYTKPEVFELLIALIIMLACIVPAWIASFFFEKAEDEKIAGLTYFTINGKSKKQEVKEESFRPNSTLLKKQYK